MLPLGIDSIKDLIETIALVGGAIAIIWGIRTYNITRSQFSFSVMISCIDRFQAIMADMNSSNLDVKLQAIKKYVDLCNEELFYFKNGYLPEEVTDEWIEGMMIFLPWFDSEEKNLNESAIREIVTQDLLKNYPRMKAAFRVNRLYDMNIFGERMALVLRIKQNLKRDPYQAS